VYGTTAPVFAETVPLSGGVVPQSANLQHLTSGSYAFIAVYNGDNNYAGSVGAVEALTINKGASSVSTVIDDSLGGPATGTLGEKVYDTATVTGSPFTPTGTFTYYFYNTANPVYGTTTPAGSETVTMGSGLVPHATTGTALAAGAYAYIGVYSGDSNYTSSVGAVEALTIIQASSSVSTVIDDSTGGTVTGALGEKVYDTATVNGTPFTPSGTVTYNFYNTATPVYGTTTPVSSQTVTLTSTGVVPNAAITAALAAGGYAYISAYSGDGNYAAAIGAVELLTIHQGASTISTVIDDATGGTVTSGLGEKVYDTATVSATPFTPTGMVTYYFYNTASPVFGKTTPVSSQTVTLTTSGAVPNAATSAALTASSYAYIAVYGGDSNYAGSIGAVEPLTIKQGTVSVNTVIDDSTGSAVTSALGEKVYDTATVSGVPFTPSGTLTYYFYNTASPVYGTTTPVSSQAVTLTSTGAVPSAATTAALTAGSYAYIGVYSGDSNYTGAVGAVEPLKINQGPSSVATTIDNATTNQPLSGIQAFGTSAFDTATVTGAPFTLTGKVTYYFYNTATPVYGTTTPVSSQAVTLTSNGAIPNSSASGSLIAGGYAFVAVYGGDSNYQSSVGPVEPLSIDRTTPAISTTPGGPVIINTAPPLTDSATLSGGYSLTGTVTFYLFAPGVTPNSNNSNNVYSDQVAVYGAGTYYTSQGNNAGGYVATTAGTYQWVAVYSGDTNNYPATSPYGSEPETAVASAKITVVKTADQSVIMAGQTAGFTVKITNNGTVTDTNVALTDPLPVGPGGDSNWVIDSSGTGLGAGTTPAAFTITTSGGTQSLTLSSAFLSGGDSLAAGQSISVHITSPTNTADGNGGAAAPANSFDPTGTAAAGLVTLGTAGNYAVLGLAKTKINNSLVTVYGNEGVSSGGSLSNAAPSEITGNVYQYASGEYSGPGKLDGALLTNATLLNQNDADALAASTAAAHLKATQTFGSISSATTITGNGGLNVININGNITLGSSNSLILQGSASDVFIVNVTGTLSINGSAQLTLAGGVTSNHILYNFTASSGSISSQVGNVWYGTILAPNLSYSLDGVYYGELIAGGSSISLLSGVKIYASTKLSNTATVTAAYAPAQQSTAQIIIYPAGPSVSPGGNGTSAVSAGAAATIGYWHNKNGQALISGFNGSAGSTALGNWMASNFPNLFGSFAGQTNTQIAADFLTAFGNVGGVQGNTYAQTFGVALAVYATDPTLGGSSAATGQGFTVKPGGTASDTYNVGSNGAAFGVANNTSLTVMQVLQTLNSNYNPTTKQFYGGDTTLTTDANNVSNGINQSGDIQNAVLDNAGHAYAPAQVRTAYSINALSSLDGTGQTIAVVDAYDNPAIFQALDAFDQQFGLTASGPNLFEQYGGAASFLTVLNESGQTSNLPATDPTGGWELEEALDVEWIHAMAPGAQIVLVEADSQSLADLMASVATAAAQPGVSVVSMSWGFAEGQAVLAADEAQYDGYFEVPGVTFVASTGDYGTADPVYPAFSPNVVAVGGTSLLLNADDSYNSETGWGYFDSNVGAYIAGGGGISQYEAQPAYQQGVQSTGYRTTPDVSFVADPATGVWIADTYNLDPSTPWEVVGGTSLAAPSWAGLIALVNQGRAGLGAAVLNSSNTTETQQDLYSLSQTDYNAITSGNNGYSAGPGYNLVGGLGSPIASLLVPDLVAGNFPSSGQVAPISAAELVYSPPNGGSQAPPASVMTVFTALIGTQNTSHVTAANDSEFLAGKTEAASSVAAGQGDLSGNQPLGTTVQVEVSPAGIRVPLAGLSAPDVAREEAAAEALACLDQWFAQECAPLEAQDNGTPAVSTSDKGSRLERPQPGAGAQPAIDLFWARVVAGSIGSRGTSDALLDPDVNQDSVAAAL
jgi:hypothetical protein